MPSVKKPASEKKARATPNANPFGLSARDVEIMVCAWKCLEEMPKVDKKLLAQLTGIPLPDSAGRQYRKIMAIIKDAKVDLAAPGTPGTPTAGKGGIDPAAVDAALGDPDSPSVQASDKKNNKNKPGAPKTAGRKRVLNEADDAHGGDEGLKNETDGEERPKKIPRLALGQPIVTVKTIEAAQGLGSDELEAGEA